MRWMRSGRWLLGMVLILGVLGCGGGGSSGNDDDDDDGGLPVPTTIPTRPTGTEAITPNLYVQSFNAPSFSQQPYLGSSLYQSPETTFELPADTISFALSIFDDAGSQKVGFTSLIDPQGREMLAAANLAAYESLPLRPSFDAGFRALLVPTVPTMSATGGIWKFRAASLDGSAASLRLSVRQGSLPAKASVPVQPFLTGNRFKTSDLQPSLDRMKSIYAQAGLTLVIAEPIVLSGNQYQAVSSNFEDALTSAMIIGNAQKTQVNLFFVEDLQDEDGSTLGIAGGIPGPIGIQKAQNAVLIGLLAHLIRGTLSTKLLGETAAHEMGHWLGLYHPTEDSGRSFDPLDDTPECSSTFDSNRDGSVSVEECLTRGGTNLMFWVGSTTRDQSELTSQQIQIMSANPIAR